MSGITLVGPNMTTHNREEAIQDLLKWKILRDVPEFIIRQVRFATVARRLYEEDTWGDYALMITHDDQAYVIGDNREGQLGIDRKTKYVKRAMKVEELSGLGIIDDGQLFMMGANHNGQLGQGHQKKLALPQRVFKEINLKVVKAACGSGHTICLAANGSIYGWGRNSSKQCNPESADPVSTPMRIRFPDDGIKIVDIACAPSTSFAVTTEGHLYGWGYNINGEVGIGATEKVVNSPTKIDIPEAQSVQSISCGYDHCVVLTSKGTIFVWGSNCSGQLGTGMEKNAACLPTKVNIADVVSISATNGMRSSVCTTLDGGIFAWGEFLHPITTRSTVFRSINDCRSHFELGMSETWVSKYRPSKVEPDYLGFLRNLADKKKITFKVEGENIIASELYMLRCDFFREKLEGEWKKELITNGFIKITEFKAKYFKLFANFLHTDRVDDATGEDLIDLLKLAHFYKMERFRSIITRLMKVEMTTANVVQFYTASLEHKDEVLHWETINFIKPRAVEILDTLDLTALEQRTVMRLLTDIQALGALKSKH